MRKVICSFLSIAMLFFSTLLFSGCSRETTTVLDKTPVYYGNAEIISTEVPDNNALTNENNGIARDSKGKEYSLEFIENELCLYQSVFKETQFEGITNSSSTRLYGTDQGFDTLYLFADNYLYKFENDNWMCLISLQETATEYFYETDSMYMESGYIYFYGSLGAGDTSLTGLIKLSLIERPSDVETLSVAAIGFSDYTELETYEIWINNAALLFNASNADCKVTISAYPEATTQFICDAVANNSFDLIFFSENYLSMMTNSDYLTDIDHNLLDTSEINQNVLAACDSDWIVPFYSLQCAECNSDDSALTCQITDYSELSNPGGHIFSHDSSEELLEFLLPAINSESYTQENIENLLSFCKSNGSGSYNEDCSIEENLVDGNIRFINENIKNVYQYITYREYFINGMSLLDIGGNNGIRYHSDVFFGIPTNSNKPEVYSFINFCLSEEAQKLSLTLVLDEIPVNQNTSDALITSAFEAYTGDGFYSSDNPVNIFDEDIYFDYRILTDSEIEENIDNALTAMEEGRIPFDYSDVPYRHTLNDINEVINDFCTYINSGTSFYTEDSFITDIIFEEAQYYFNDLYTLEDASEHIVNRVSTYLSECENN